MRLSAELQRKVTTLLISLSLLAWLLLVLQAGGNLDMEICRSITLQPSQPGLSQIENFLPRGEQFLAWILMIMAMMGPKLILPLQQLLALSLKRLRLLTASLFILGYFCSWTLAAIPLQAIKQISTRWLTPSYMPALVCLICALIWQCSPIKQFFLNQGRQHKIIRAFGYQAAYDAFSYGLRHGAYCVGAGWLLMLMPLLVTSTHFPAMALVTFIMLSEHLQSPRPVKWRVDFRLQLARYLLQRTGKWLGEARARLSRDARCE